MEPFLLRWRDVNFNYHGKHPLKRKCMDTEEREGIMIRTPEKEGEGGL